MLTPFNPPPGINSDDTTFAAEGQWADGSNVRFRNGRAETIGAVGPQFTLAALSRTGDVFPFLRAGSTYVAYGLTGGDLYVGDGLASPVDRSPAGSFSNFGWSFAAWGDALLGAPDDGTLYEQSGASNAAAVTAAPDRITTMLSSRRQVIAFGCNEEISTNFNTRCVRWSDIEDYTDWSSSPTNNAGEFVLDGTGDIIGAKELGDYIVILTRTEIWLMSYVGDPSETYRFERVGDSGGLIGKRALTVVGGTLYWLGHDLQFRAYRVGAAAQVIPCPVRKEFVLNANLATGVTPTVLMAPVSEFNEIWCFYSDLRGDPVDKNSRYVAYCIEESVRAQRPVWFRGILDRVAFCDSGLLRPLNSSAPGEVLGIDRAGVVYLHEVAQSGGTPADYIQSAAQYLDNSQRRMMIRGIVQDFEGQSGAVLLTLHLRDRPLSNAVTKGPFMLIPGETKKDFRVSGKIAAVRFSGEQGTAWRLGKALFDTVALGER